LIITEGTHISPFSVTRKTAAAHYTDKQHGAWIDVVNSIHRAGGIVFQQLYHVGRKALLSTLPEGQYPVAPSAIAATGGILVNGVLEPFPTPRALETSEIASIVKEYRQATINARDAGFDGVEILAANGFLIDQFLRDQTNLRTDKYGGDLQRRARFLLEVVDAAIDVLGADRIGVRLSPHFRMDGAGDSNPVETFGYVASALNERRIAYLHVLEGTTRDDNPYEEQYLRMLKRSDALCGPSGTEPFLAPIFRQQFSGPLILNGGYDRATAIKTVEDGVADAISFGRLFISNPDLPERIRVDAPMNEPDTATFFSGREKGYIDYPFLSALRVDSQSFQQT
jgi:N-ethylmaleimide reductase